MYKYVFVSIIYQERFNRFNQVINNQSTHESEPRSLVLQKKIKENFRIHYIIISLERKIFNYFS